VYTSIIERISDYGILKSIGASNAGLYATVLVQSAIITVLGFVLGAFLSVYVGRAIEALLPQFEVVVGVSTMIKGAVAAVIMAAVAAGFHDYKNERYYFDSLRCLEQFRAEPEKYLKGGPVESGT
ncbi:MAG: YHS domain-containing protein, partial [Actinomycetota bacterium]|nr:YHS domain-containing protein [Actinomycetota bacterium]